METAIILRFINYTGRLENKKESTMILGFRAYSGIMEKWKLLWYIGVIYSNK